jgi:hypothetical protein
MNLFLDAAGSLAGSRAEGFRHSPDLRDRLSNAAENHRSVWAPPTLESDPDHGLADR